VAYGHEKSADMFHVCRVISDELSQFGIQGNTEYSGRHHARKKGRFKTMLSNISPPIRATILETHGILKKSKWTSPWSTECLKPRNGYFGKEGLDWTRNWKNFERHRKKEELFRQNHLEWMGSMRFFYFFSSNSLELWNTLYQDLSRWV